MRRVSTPLALLLVCCSTNDDDGMAGETEASTESSSATSSSAGDAGDATTTRAETSAATADGSSDDASTTATSSGDDDDSADDDSSDDGSSDGGELRPGPDFRLLGPHTVETETGQFAIKQGCSMGYTRFAPDGVTPDGTVILAHGFQGNRGSMAGWAEHLASWGVEVFTPDLCHATIIDSDHAQNGLDLIDLREHLSLGSVIYAGYSAGGLAAFLAAADDASAIAVLGLDMVDNDDLGAMAASRVGIPAHDIVAEPAMCNSTANGVAVFGAASQGRVVRVTEADHCDFQNPGDALCGLCSAANPNFDTATIKATIIGLSTGFVVWQLESDATGQQWWFEGEPWFDELVADGIVTAL